jgi:branched-chain amino acid transport system substrate-binding protein
MLLGNPRQASPTRVRLIAGVVAICLTLVACGGEDSAEATLADEPVRQDPNTPIVIPADQPIVIGVSAPLTGPDAVGGEADRDAAIAGVNLWKEENGETIAGHDIEVRAEDDGCTEADIATQAAERLLRTEGLVGVIGPDCSPGAAAAIPIYSEAGVVTISGTATQTDLTEGQSGDGFFFRTSFNNALQGQLAASFASVQLQAEDVYLVDDGESYGQDLAGAVEQGLTELGITVTRATVERGAVDFSDLAAEIAEANPDFVAYAGFNPEVGLLYRQLRDAGYEGDFGSGDAAASIETFIEPVGEEAAEGVYFSGCPLPLPDAYRDQLDALGAEQSEASAFLAHLGDAARVLLDAVGAVAEEGDDGSLTIDPLELRDAVAATSFDDGISGHISFDDAGDRATDETDLAEQALDLGWAGCQVQDGQFEVQFP